jgi:trimeric autotransporter adhesin
LGLQGQKQIPSSVRGLVGPGVKTLDFSISKSFKMPWAEGHSLMFRAEAYNATNTPQFGTPNVNFGDSSFGRITGTRANNREMQLALKYSF